MSPSLAAHTCSRIARTAASSLLKSHLIRSERGLIEPPVAVCAPGTRSVLRARTQHTSRSELVPPMPLTALKTSFCLFHLQHSCFSNFLLCIFCWIFHILLFSRWVNFNSEMNFSIHFLVFNGLAMLFLSAEGMRYCTMDVIFIGGVAGSRRLAAHRQFAVRLRRAVLTARSL